MIPVNVPYSIGLAAAAAAARKSTLPKWYYYLTKSIIILFSRCCILFFRFMEIGLKFVTSSSQKPKTDYVNPKAYSNLKAVDRGQGER